MYSTGCASYTGYKVPEICSSGMTHLLEGVKPTIEHTIESHTPKQFAVSIKVLNIFLNFYTIIGEWNIHVN